MKPQVGDGFPTLLNHARRQKPAPTAGSGACQVTAAPNSAKVASEAWGYAHSAVPVCSQSPEPLSGSLDLGHPYSQQEPPRKGFCAVREPHWSEQRRAFGGPQMGAGFPWQLVASLPGSRIGTLRTQGYSIPHLSALQLPLNWVSEARLQAKPPAPWMPGCPSPYPVPLFISFGLQRLPSCTTLMVREISCGENKEG